MCCPFRLLVIKKRYNCNGDSVVIDVQIALSRPILDVVTQLQLTDQQLQRAAMRALNKTARWLRTYIARETAAELSLPVRKVSNTIQLVRARRGDVKTTVGLSKKSGVINAIDAGSARQNQRGVRVGRRHYNHAFIATMPSGHRGIYRRKNRSRLPITEVKIVLTGRMKKIMESLADHGAIIQFEKILEREVRFIGSTLS